MWATEVVGSDQTPPAGKLPARKSASCGSNSLITSAPLLPKIRIRGPGAPTTALADKYELTPLSWRKIKTASSSAAPRIDLTVAVTSSALPNQSIAVEIK